MSDIAIRADQLSKKYMINVGNAPAVSLSEGLSRAAQTLCEKFWRTPGGMHREEFWSLKEASFEIKKGEVVGVVGRNGAGKSTLLKILSRITAPTGGRAEIRGRVGTLLEVGTGFHPELTGRDNIYLSGIILGMKKSAIDRKFDEIVEFAGVEKFIDTPVKRYSSGMYVRLAFAVGAHLEPEVLIVDEVLAVGDQQFQKKCLDKMNTIGKEGRTVLFVSHNMQAITRLCQRVLCLENGRVVADGHPTQVAGTYIRQRKGSGPTQEWAENDEAPGDSVAQLRAIRIRNSWGEITDVMDIREEFEIEMEIDVHASTREFIPNVVITNHEGLDLFESFDLDPRWRRKLWASGRYRCHVKVPGNLMCEGTFFVSPACFSLAPHEVQFYEREVIAFQVIDRQQGDSARGDYSGEMLGVVRPMLKWETCYLSGSGESVRPQRAA